MGWLSEAVLWTVWQHVGRLHVEKDGVLLTISVDELQAVVLEHEFSLIDVAMYARIFIQELNKSTEGLSDLPDGAITFEDEGDDVDENSHTKPKPGLVCIGSRDMSETSIAPILAWD